MNWETLKKMADAGDLPPPVKSDISDSVARGPSMMPARDYCRLYLLSIYPWIAFCFAWAYVTGHTYSAVIILADWHKSWKYSERWW